MARFIRVSPKKTRLVLDLIRGKKAEEALITLKFLPNKPARIVEKVLQSAIANAEHNYNLDVNELFLHQVYADEGPVLKRWRARALGRASRIRKKTSHITIILKEKGRD